MTKNDDNRGLRALIDACLNNRVPFSWRGPGLLLIAGSGVGAVLKEVQTEGYNVLGFEAFELESLAVHPRLDLIFIASLRPDVPDPVDVVAEWPSDVWVDVTLEAS